MLKSQMNSVISGMDSDKEAKQVHPSLAELLLLTYLACLDLHVHVHAVYVY